METYKTFEKLKYEIETYDTNLFNEKKIIIAINKIDLINENEQNEIIKQFETHEIQQISCFLRKGIEELEHKIIEVINETHRN